MQFKTIAVTQRNCMITFKSVSGTILFNRLKSLAKSLRPVKSSPNFFVDTVLQSDLNYFSRVHEPYLSKQI